jgi:hypothetical protein
VPGRGFGRWRRAAASGCGGGLRLRAVAAGCGFGLWRRVAAVGRGFGRWRRAAGCGGGLWLWASAPKLHGRLVAIRWSHLGREVHPALLRSDTADDKTRRDGHARKCPLVAPDPPATCQPRDGRALLFDDSAVPLLAWSRAAAEGRQTALDSTPETPCGTHLRGPLLHAHQGGARCRGGQHANHHRVGHLWGGSAGVFRPSPTWTGARCLCGPVAL